MLSTAASISSAAPKACPESTLWPLLAEEQEEKKKKNTSIVLINELKCIEKCILYRVQGAALTGVHPSTHSSAASYRPGQLLAVLLILVILFGFGLFVRRLN